MPTQRQHCFDAPAQAASLRVGQAVAGFGARRTRATFGTINDEGCNWQKRPPRPDNGRYRRRLRLCAENAASIMHSEEKRFSPVNN